MMLAPSWLFKVSKHVPQIRWHFCVEQQQWSHFLPLFFWLLPLLGVTFGGFFEASSAIVLAGRLETAVTVPVVVSVGQRVVPFVGCCRAAVRLGSVLLFVGSAPVVVVVVVVDSQLRSLL